jgi:O-antigen/teichoic acid export membrane protein
MLKGPIAKATISTSFVLCLRLFAQAGTLLIVARMLGPEQFGVFAAIAGLAVLFGAFSTFGTHLVLLGEVSKNQEASSRILAYAVPTTLICGSLLFLLYLLICSLFFKAVSISWIVYICIGCTEIVLLPVYLLPTIPFLARGKTALSQLLTILPLILRLVCAIIILFFDFGNSLELFSYGYVVIALLVLFVMKINKKQAWLKVREWRLANRQELKESAGYATLALTALGPGELDKVLAVKLLPLGISGLYAAASRVVGAATLPVIALLLSAMPRMFREAEHNPMKNQQLLTWIFILVLIYGFILVGFLWLAAPVIEWLFGVKYTGMVEILQFLAVALPGLALRLASGSVLMTFNKPWWRASFEFFGMFIFVCIALCFSRYWGVKGMGLALIFSEWGMAVISIVSIFMFRKRNIIKCH